MSAPQRAADAISIDTLSAATTEDSVAVARHWTGLDGVAAVPTQAFEDAQDRLARVTSINGICVVSGPTGSGKSFSADYFIRHHPAATSRPRYWLQLGHKPTVKAVTIRMLEGLGQRPNPRDSEYVLVEDLIPLLCGSNAVVVIDEAQGLSANALQQLRYFHDRCMPFEKGDPPGWTLILVGTTVDRTLAGVAELRNRVAAWATFTKLDDAELLATLRRWHPTLAELPPSWLLQIDRAYCHGNWRHWAQFLAAYLAQQHDQRPQRSESTPQRAQRLVKQALADVKRQAREVAK